MARNLWKAAAVVVVLVGSTQGSYAGPADVCERTDAVSVSTGQQEDLRISYGIEGKRAWLAATYKQLSVNKVTNHEERSFVIELVHDGDVLLVSYNSGAVVVSRAGRTLPVTSPTALQKLQHLLAGSTAAFAARTMLSELEGESDLKAPAMSLLSSLAFVSSLAGDLNAPKRLADRFVEKHRGIFRQVRADPSCWSNYSTESTRAWEDLQNCMNEAEDDGFFSGAYQRLACNAVWVARSESAWFEYIKCLSPLTGVPKIGL
ncbi:MAG: hypothetical protein LC753_14515 [Acidobacteria bacterium]|nr:hypothetical protein [Acidobacteriota bacterium]MCA1651427.1 hypothetical protein [Acidobacteriota bacterium]